MAWAREVSEHVPSGCLADFFCWCGVKFLLLLLFSATVAYFLGRIIYNRSNNSRLRTIALVVGILYSLGALFYFKYFFGLMDTVLAVFGLEGTTLTLNLSAPALPLGISFYTFSILSYLLDVYWEKCAAQKNIFNIWLYVMFFPKVVQGPIMRYSDFELQLYGRVINITTVDQGFQRFIIGMFKKIFIANQLTSLVSYSFDNIHGVGTVPAWLGIIAYLLQLYYDFSGYSDMAVGLGIMFGFKLPENFDHPYMSSSVAEYWRRWHISLGAWFRDYLYMPLYRICLCWKFSKRIPMFADLFALGITWLLTGIWHGSGLNFVVYGLWYFLFIAIERVRNYRRKKILRQKGLKKLSESLGVKVIKHVVTLFAVLIGQVLFRASDLGTAAAYISKMFRFDTTDGWVFITELSNSVLLVLLLGLIFCFPVSKVLRDRVIAKYAATEILYRLILFGMFFIAFIYMISADFQPFLYEIF